MGERLERLWPSFVALIGTVAVVLGLLWLFGGEVDDSTPDDVVAGDDVPADDQAGAGGDDGATGDEAGTDAGGEQPTDEPTADEESPDADPTTAPPELREPVGIVNQTSVEGLAEHAQQRLEEGGWEVPAIGPFTGTVPETTVYYPDGMEDAAAALSAQFPEIGRVQPTFEGLNPTRLVVVLVDDYVDEVGEPE